MSTTHTVYVGLGSNLGDREQNLRAARESLSAAGIVLLRASAIYESAPRDFLNQPWFLNQVIEAETRLFPLQLLRKLQRIEASMGRRRTISKGPRIIDLDLLTYGGLMLELPGLVLPHPRMSERRFVLEPLAELAPDLRPPARENGAKAPTVQQLLSEVRTQTVRRFLPAATGR